MPESAGEIIAVAEECFGVNSRPKAIVLTHGHFDHVGAVVDLVKHWNGGAVAKMSPFFPIEPVNLGDQVQALPADGTVPHLTDFRWIHTPGHSPGHVSLFRDKDRSLIAGDAFVTVKQDSLYKVFTQEVEINGPPRYLTTDWPAAWDSVKKLAALKPSVAICGHGMPVSGELLSRNPEKLVKQFDQIAIPDYGKYVNKH